MNTFYNLHPFTLFIYFFCVIFISIFSFNPYILGAGMLGAAAYLLMASGRKAILKSLIFYLILFLAVSLTNPLFSHNGKTILFFINDSRITLEAFVYGAALAFAIAEIILWFKCFNLVFNSEKLIFIFGKLSPKLALVISMTLRFIPNLLKNYKSIYNTQKLLKGSRFKHCINSFSAVITLSMENSIITADSMKARGYGLKKRSFYTRFRITLTDVILIIISALLFTVSIIGKAAVEYYPVIVFPTVDIRTLTGYTAYTILVFIPFIIEVRESVRWNYSVSKI